MDKADCTVKSFRECSLSGKNYECGTTFTFELQVIKANDNDKDLALYVLLEHNFDTMTVLLQNLMEEGLIPYGMLLFVIPGALLSSLPGAVPRRMRAAEFDQYGPEFANLLVEEMIPEACRISGENLSPLPDMHFISGGSSGGMAAWNAVWFRNDFFRRAFLSSPTFSAMRGGEEAMVIARKTETKPIKLYITTGTEEPDYFFGSSLLAAQNAASALEFAGYDLRFEQFNGEGHCCRREDVTLWRRMMKFLWANWKKVPVLPLANQIRIRRLTADNSTWQLYDGAFPEKGAVTFNGGKYTFSGGEIFFEKGDSTQKVAGDFGKITSLGLSSDHWQLYIADETRRFIFAMAIQPDGTLKYLRKLAPLHLAYDFCKAGASDITVLEDDRVLAATELGVQGIVSFGLTDLILPLPGDIPAERIAVCGRTLYVSSGSSIYCRELKIGVSAADAPPQAPSSPRYNDQFSYTRSHLFFS